MDQELAKRLFFEGGIFVFLGVPKETVFGIDMNVWNTDDNFRGIKMIPPGLHFVHYSAVNNVGDEAPRTGFFYHFKKSEFVVKRYDQQNEGVSHAPVNESEITKLKANVLDLEKFLAPYPYNVFEKWTALTNHLSETLLATLTPTSGFIYSVLSLVPCKDEDRPRGQRADPEETGESSASIAKRKKRWSDKDADDLLPNLKPLPGTEFQFTKFPEHNYPADSTPADITRHSLDSTYVLESMLCRYESPIDFIGEIQFAFVCFLVGHNLDAFEHWKALIGLMCSCDVATVKHRNLYDLFVPVLEVQLKEIPEEFLADIVSNNNYIYCKLKTLFRTIQDNDDVDGRLKTKMSRFKTSLTDMFQWDFNPFNNDDDEDAPVIVELE